MKLHRIALYALFTVALSFPTHVASPQTPPLKASSPQGAQAPESRLIFQTGAAWSPRTNINADTVMV